MSGAGRPHRPGRVIKAVVAAAGTLALQRRHQDELSHGCQIPQLHHLPARSIALVHCLQRAPHISNTICLTLYIACNAPHTSAIQMLTSEVKWRLQTRAGISLGQARCRPIMTAIPSKSGHLLLPSFLTIDTGSEGGLRGVRHPRKSASCRRSPELHGAGWPAAAARPSCQRAGAQCRRHPTSAASGRAACCPPRLQQTLTASRGSSGLQHSCASQRCPRQEELKLSGDCSPMGPGIRQWLFKPCPNTGMQQCM